MTNDNPWNNMHEQSQRRAVTEKEHDLFWITDLEGRYGFIFYTKNPFLDFDSPANLKGINILKRNSQANQGELILVLNDNQEWEIFHALCLNLIATALKYNDSEAMINAVEIRLKRWQQLLKQNTSLEMSTEQQMGLFSELLCLKNIVYPHFGINQAITAWVGADADKQDYLLEKIALEVKSYRTSKGKRVSISSLEQMEITKDFLFLITYGLTVNANGKSIEDLVEIINDLLLDSKNNLIELFESKLTQYGYIPEVKKTPYIKFIVDKQQQYSVSEKFPKISRNQVSSLITHVKYSIDLAQCGKYEVGIDTIMNKAKP